MKGKTNNTLTMKTFKEKIEGAITGESQYIQNDMRFSMNRFAYLYPKIEEIVRELVKEAEPKVVGLERLSKSQQTWILGAQKGIKEYKANLLAALGGEN